MISQRIHEDQPVLVAGQPLEQARAAMIMIHGRGATAEDILSLAGEFDDVPFTYLAPQAAGYQWYPNRFMEPIATNEPYLSSALATVAGLVDHIVKAGIPAERIMLLGFSQGACLTLEYAARHAQRYGGLIGLSGGLIGPDDTPRDYPGSLDGTPVFLGCSDIDPHIPKKRVEDSAVILERLGGSVTWRLYPRMGHTVNRDEIDAVKAIMADLVKDSDKKQ